MYSTRFSSVLVLVVLAGCVENQAYVGDAADREATACESEKIVQFVNAGTTDAAALKAIGVASRGADNLIAQRNGADGVFGTSDDSLYATFQQIDAVSQVGDSSVAALLAFGEGACAGEVEEEE